MLRDDGVDVWNHMVAGEGAVLQIGQLHPHFLWCSLLFVRVIQFLEFYVPIWVDYSVLEDAIVELSLLFNWHVEGALVQVERSL